MAGAHARLEGTPSLPCPTPFPSNPPHLLVYSCLGSMAKMLPRSLLSTCGDRGTEQGRRGARDVSACRRGRRCWLSLLMLMPMAKRPHDVAGGAEALLVAAGMRRRGVEPSEQRAAGAAAAGAASGGAPAAHPLGCGLAATTVSWRRPWARAELRWKQGCETDRSCATIVPFACLGLGWEAGGAMQGAATAAGRDREAFGLGGRASSRHLGTGVGGVFWRRSTSQMHRQTVCAPSRAHICAQRPLQAAPDASDPS